MFKYVEITKFLIELKKIAPVYNLSTAKENEFGSILRHDIDVSVESAYNLAQIEYEHGIFSSILFLTTCPLYNIQSSENRRLIQTLASQGFDIGLHFDPTIYNTDNIEKLQKNVELEIKIIENITGVSVKSVSLHCPSIHGMYPVFKGLNNAYDDGFFNPDLYISDSRMSFRDKIPFEFISKAQNNMIQILLHPFHYSKSGGNYKVLFNQLIKKYFTAIDQNFRPYNSKYISDLEGKTISDLYI